MKLEVGSQTVGGWQLSEHLAVELTSCNWQTQLPTAHCPTANFQVSTLAPFPSHRSRSALHLFTVRTLLLPVGCLCHRGGDRFVSAPERGGVVSRVRRCGGRDRARSV